MRNRDSDTTRGGGSALVLLTPTSEVAPAQPVTFSWRSYAGLSATLELLDPNGAVVFSQLTPDTSLTLRQSCDLGQLSLVGAMRRQVPRSLLPAGPADPKQVEQYQGR